MSRPLNDLLVVSLEQATAAPYCTRLLADQGARVIKVERPSRSDSASAYDSGFASHFVWTNHSKQSLAPDLKERSATLRRAHHHEAYGGSYTRKPCPAVMMPEDRFDATV